MAKPWIPPAKSLPVDGEIVDWLMSDGNILRGGKKGPGKLWLLPPAHKTYAYYEPTFWRHSCTADGNSS